MKRDDERSAILSTA
jgi:alanyl-tRNA synthetase